MKTKLPPRREVDPFTLPQVRVIGEIPKESPLRFVVREEMPAYHVQRPQLDAPEAIEKFYRDVVEKSPDYEPSKEHLVLFLLNARMEVTGWSVVSKGNLNETVAHVREVLRPVMLAGAYGFVICHNHPSGDPSPSRADEHFTRRLEEASTLMQLKFLDHVIIGAPGRVGGSYMSFREAGVIY